MAPIGCSTHQLDAHYAGNVGNNTQEYSFVRPQIYRCVQWLARYVHSVALIALVLLSLAENLSAATGAHWIVVNQPVRLVNGSPVLFRVTTPTPVRALSGNWLGHEIAFSFGEG